MDADDRPTDERAAARRRARGDKAEQASAAKHARAARYYATHREHMRESAQQWRAENPDRARTHNREHMRRAAAARKARDERRTAGRAWYQEHRDEERERHRQFRTAHPDKIREYQQRYRANHPDRAAENARTASQRWRDRNPDAVREENRLAARRRRAANPGHEKRKYQDNLAVERARSRTNARRRSRLSALGLPARHIHTVYAEEKRANQAAADAFFALRRTMPRIHALQLEKDSAPYTRVARADARRIVTGEQSPPDPALQAARRIEAEHDLWLRVLPGIVTAFADRHRDRIRDEIRMDSIARRLSGKPPYDIAFELAHRIRTEAFQHAVARLAPDASPARLQRLHQMMFPTQHAHGERETARRREQPTAASPLRSAGVSR